MIVLLQTSVVAAASLRPGPAPSEVALLIVSEPEKAVRISPCFEGHPPKTSFLSLFRPVQGADRGVKVTTGFSKKRNTASYRLLACAVDKILGFCAQSFVFNVRAYGTWPSDSS